jgi:hypothetical protein
MNERKLDKIKIFRQAQLSTFLSLGTGKSEFDVISDTIFHHVDLTHFHILTEQGSENLKNIQ